MDFADKKIFKLLLFVFAIFLSCCKSEETAAPLVTTETKDKIPFSIGTNLSTIDDFTSGFAFADAFKQSRAWVSVSSKTWEDGRDFFLDEHGWVKLLKADQRAATMMFTELNGKYPSGIYTLRYKGDGKFRIYGNGFVGILKESKGEKLIQLNADAGGIIIEILETNPDDYIRDMHFYFPGGVCEDDPTQGCDDSCSSGAKCLKFTEHNTTFHPLFLKNISIYSTLRFMEWMIVNNSKQMLWRDRPKIEDYTWTAKGVPLEIMIELANLTNKNPWFCMPHLADDDYIKNFARVVKKNLKPELKTYLEYSNEVWNTIFEQAKYAEKMGMQIEEDPRAREKYYAIRSEEIFDIWSNVFKDDSRLTKVVSAQAAYNEVAKAILAQNISANALAIAPYFEPATEINENTLAEIDFKNYIEILKFHKELAKSKGMELISYEAGQHILLGNNPQNIALAEKLNRSLKMEELYSEYIKIWQDQVNSLLMHYTSVGQCTRYGCWGAKQSYLEPDELSPKYRVLKNFAQKH